MDVGLKRLDLDGDVGDINCEESSAFPAGNGSLSKFPAEKPEEY